MPLASRETKKPPSLRSLVFLLAVPVILLGALLLGIIGWIPGASLLLAWDCVSDGSCLVSAMFATRIQSASFVGPWAYSLGALCVALTYLVAWLAVTRTLSFFSPSRTATRSQLLLHAMTLGYVAVDTILVWWLTRLFVSST